MVIFKFEKTSTASLVAHVDTLRAVTYIFRRANLPVEYSHGFNPHMELGFSSPLALGVESLCEYVSAKMPFSEGLLEKINAVSPKGIKFTDVFPKEMNLAAKIDSATYKIEALGIGNVVEEILSPNYEITYQEKGVNVSKDVSSRILSAKKQSEDCAFITLTLGNNNLRPDRLVLHLMNKYDLQGDYKITKTESFVDGVPTDEYLQNL